MSDRVDEKLREVAVAHYGYRHEAEFAAGFLEDARSPYRLQLDDPAMGLAISASATIWVLSMDADRAREVLDLDDDGGSPTLLAKPSGSPASRRATSAGMSVAGRHAHRVPGPPTSLRLSARERILSVLAAIGLAGGGMYAFADGGSVVVQAVVAAVVIGLNLIGLTGRAPAALRRLLAALAGTAP